MTTKAVDLNPPKTIPIRILGPRGEELVAGHSALGQSELFRLLQRGELTIREVEQGKVPPTTLPAPKPVGAGREK